MKRTQVIDFLNRLAKESSPLRAESIRKIISLFEAMTDHRFEALKDKSS